MNYHDTNINSLDFSSLSLNETAQPSNGMFKLVGSKETRQAYSSLQQLHTAQNYSNEINSQKLRSSLQVSIASCQSEDDSGFFISDDDMDCDENLW